MRIAAVPAAAAGALAPLHAESFDRPWTAADLRELAVLPGVTSLAALDAEEEALGFVMLRRAADEAEILTLAVAPAARRRGVGRALVEAAVAHAPAALFLEVAADNAAARALYAAAGFREAGRRRGYYPRPGGEAQDALVLRRGA